MGISPRRYTEIGLFELAALHNGLVVLMESIWEAVPATFSVLVMILVLFYIFAILFTEIVGHNEDFLDNEDIQKHFGTVANSLAGAYTRPLLSST
jgi:hypothetical protein